MKITLAQFSGVIPRLAPRLLPNDNAQVARNLRLDSGDLEPWRAPKSVQALDRASATTLYLFAHQYWFQWAGDVDVVRGPIPGDTTERTYFTGTDQPRFTNNALATTGSGAYPIASYTLGIPAPVSAVTATVVGTVTDNDPSLIESRAYTYTYVSQFGEQGPPAPASDIVDVAPGQHVDVSGLAAPSGAFVIDNIRIYRTASSGGGTKYEFVDEVPVSTQNYTDEVTSDGLGEVLPSEDWVGPPEDMHSLVALPNGILAGASGIDVCISEQYRPHAWPYAYRQAVDDTIVGLGVVANSIVVLTERRPYLITGSSPASMAMTAIGSAEFACVSKRGIVDMPGMGVVFPAANGLCAISAAQAVNLTEAFMDRDQWQALNPQQMLGLAHRGRYFGFHDTGCLVFDPGRKLLYEMDITASGGYVDPYTDALYLIRDGEIQEWNAGSALPYQWRSKVYELPYPAVFSAARVRADNYGDVHLKFYVDGRHVSDVVPVSDRAFRLPAMPRGKRMEIVVSGSGRVQDISVAENVREVT